MIFIKRVLTAVIGIMILVPVCLFSYTVVWPLVMTMLSVIATFEVLRCVGLHKTLVIAVPFYGFSLLPLSTWLLVVYRRIYMNRVIVAGVFLLFLCEFLSILITKNKVPGDKVYSSIALVTYVVFAFTALTMSRLFENGSYLFLLVFLGAWGSDTFAFVSGKLFGKHKLCPEISPRKTVEGAVGAIIGNALFFALYALFLNLIFHATAGIWQFALLGAVLSVMGQLGDMFASSVKRYYGIKDFGKLLPGHGGVLDRFDSILGISCAMFVVYNVFGSGLFVS